MSAEVAQAKPQDDVSILDWHYFVWIAVGS